MGVVTARIEIGPSGRIALVALLAATVLTAVVVVAIGTTVPLVPAFASVFVVPPPILAPLIGGIAARRGGYLVGTGLGLVSAIAFALVVFTIPSSTAIPATTDDRTSVALYGLVVSPLFGMAIGATGAAIRHFVVERPLRNSKTCVQCGGRVNDAARVCPLCGFDFAASAQWRKDHDAP